jgi:hypothetical protein
MFLKGNIGDGGRFKKGDMSMESKRLGYQPQHHFHNQPHVEEKEEKPKPNPLEKFAPR